MTWYQYKKHFPTGVVTGESTAAHCHGLTKAILFSSPVWGVAYSLAIEAHLCWSQARCSKSWSTWLVGNHMDFRTIYPLTTGINCTRYCSCNYSQTAFKSMWLSAYIHITIVIHWYLHYIQELYTHHWLRIHPNLLNWIQVTLWTVWHIAM